MTRLELEARRMQAIPLLDSSMMQSKIARRIGVSRTTVSRWKRARMHGSSLQRSLSPGRPPRLTVQDIEVCKSIYRRSRRKWTQKTFYYTGVKYDPDHVGRLMHQWGLRTKRVRK